MTTVAPPRPTFSTPRPLQFVGQVEIGQDFNTIIPKDADFLEEVTGTVDDYHDYRHWLFDLNGDGVADLKYMETYWREYPEYSIRQIWIEEGTNRDGPASQLHHALIQEGDLGDGTGTGYVSWIEDDDNTLPGRSYWADHNLDGRTDEEVNELADQSDQLKDSDFDGTVDEVIYRWPAV